MGIASANLVDFHYELQGVGDQDLVLISPLGCDLSVWNNLSDSLGDRFRILMFDNQGAGRTEDYGEALSIEEMADNIVTLFEELGIRHPIIIGHSLGADIAQQIAHEHPTLPAELILINPLNECRNEVMLNQIHLAFEGLTRPLSDENLSRQFDAVLRYNSNALSIDSTIPVKQIDPLEINTLEELNGIVDHCQHFKALTA